MSEYVKTIDAIKIDGLILPGFLVPSEKEIFESSKIRILEILKIFRNTGAILDSSKDIPLELVIAFATLFGEFKAAHVNGFIEIIPDSQEAQKNYRQGMINLLNYHGRFFDTSSNNNMLSVINAINNYKFQDSVQLDVQAHKAIEEIKYAKENIDKIREELAKQATKRVLRDYVDIFRIQEGKHRNASIIWLLISILISIAFLWLLISSIRNNWFPNKIELDECRDGRIYTSEVFNIPLLVSKVVIVSFILFLISFFFRQYSINRNLQVINEQRKNAFDSYDLFAAAAGSDNTAKNVLLMQLAKTILQNIHTGFLSGKQSDPSNNQLLELSRFYQNNEKQTPG